MSGATVLVFTLNQRLKWSLCFPLKPTYNSWDVINSLQLATCKNKVKAGGRGKHIGQSVTRPGHIS